MGFVTEVLSGTGHKLAAAQREFWSFVLPDGSQLTPQQRSERVKQAFASQFTAGQTPTSAAVPLSQAQQTMQGFMGGTPYQAGQGTPYQAGQGPLDVGLDRPHDTKAKAMPGMSGHAATNIIDRQGGLDPRGMTVDGNNAAGVAKGFKMGSAETPGPTVGDLLLAAAESSHSSAGSNELSELSQPTGAGIQKTSCESSHSDEDEAVALFAGSQLSQLLAAT